MITSEDRDRARRAEELYARRLKAILEPAQNGKYVAIEADSGEYFLADTLEQASAAARKAHPSKVCYARRVCYPYVVELGSTS